MAEKIASDIGCERFFRNEEDNKEWFMPCEQHALLKVGNVAELEKPETPAGDTPNKNPKDKERQKATQVDLRGR